MAKDAHKVIFRHEYQVPRFLIDQVHLHFDLGEEHTQVHSQLWLRRNPASQDASRLLELNGQELELLEVRLDGQTLTANEYQLDDRFLRLQLPADEAQLDIITRTQPQLNTALEGLYKSGGNFCTQCEAEGFRRITYYLDRPDVMARFTTTVTADQARYPVLLSNGNPVESGQLADGKHWVRWEDPFPKPCYLFALVAGPLARATDTFTTASGREVKLEIYVAPDDLDKTDHAMHSLKKAMAWDEQRWGLEYDLDIYMIVAVHDFNMGAMENKGLNIFNSRFVLAKPDTATDQDYDGIESVIGHEYFHNWTGNRITCRDWFQLSLKEGLTVFRDQEFSSDVGSRAVKRIADVRLLRTHQFAEDGGPMAHPVRPDSYIEMNNFYTHTVYEKGSEVVRMMHTLLGPERFRAGMDLYFQRHDNQAVTCDDFAQAMADAGGRDLEQFKRWYAQSGTPVVNVRSQYDSRRAEFTLTLSQSCPPTPEQANKDPFHIPFAIGLLGQDGQPLKARLQGQGAAANHEWLLELTGTQQDFVFEGVQQAPVLSLLRGFSAPVKLECEQSDSDLLVLMAHDDDAFSRWDAAQRLSMRYLLTFTDAFQQDQHAKPLIPEAFIEAIRGLLTDESLDPALLAETLLLPAEAWLAQQYDVVHVDAIHAGREYLLKGLAQALSQEFVSCYQRLLQQDQQADQAYAFCEQQVASRALRARCLKYLAHTAAGEQLCNEALASAHNMTDTMAALEALRDIDCASRAQALAAFYQRWQADPLVVNKWFLLQATSSLPGTLDEVKALLAHPRFDLKVPNCVRALVGGFAMHNPVRFHAEDGSGYAFLVDQVIALNELNPQVAARILGAMNGWRKQEPHRAALMRQQLERLRDNPDLSNDVYEIAVKALEY